MFIVFNKQKIYSYLVALSTVVVLFVIAFAVTNHQEEMVQTSSNVEISYQNENIQNANNIEMTNSQNKKEIEKNANQQNSKNINTQNHNLQ